MTMKQKTIIAIAALALCPMAACAFADEKLNALIDAAHSNAVGTARLLIKAGADVDAKDKFAETALMYAAQNNAADTTKLLIKAGADVNAKTRQEWTALRYAEEREAAEVIALLKAAGAKE